MPIYLRYEIGLFAYRPALQTSASLAGRFGCGKLTVRNSPHLRRAGASVAVQRVLNAGRFWRLLTNIWRRSQVAKAADCKSAIVGPTPTGASPPGFTRQPGSKQDATRHKARDERALCVSGHRGVSGCKNASTRHRYISTRAPECTTGAQRRWQPGWRDAKNSRLMA